MHSSRDFRATLEFIERARRHDATEIEHIALLMGALFSYERPFRDATESVSHSLPSHHNCFLDFAIDLGMDLSMHASLMDMSNRAIAHAQTVLQPVSDTHDRTVHSFVFPNRISKMLTHTLDLDAFERITRVMLLACHFALRE
ncbi:MAG TPA: hypothetical protein VIY54_12075 [Steroidobacteraceae bacterium]